MPGINPRPTLKVFRILFSTHLLTRGGTAEPRPLYREFFLAVRPLGRTRLAFPRRIPGLKSETWGTLRVSRTESVWGAQGLEIRLSSFSRLFSSCHFFDAELCPDTH
jgi:hypothetical protein